MGNSKEFTQAWYHWRHSMAPIANFRLQRTDAPTYRIEHDLDHLASYIYALGLKAVGNEPVDYAKLASQELVELEKIISELERCNISADEKESFTTYLAATRLVLEGLIKISTTQLSPSA